MVLSDLGLQQTGLNVNIGEHGGGVDVDLSGSGREISGHGNFAGFGSACDRPEGEVSLVLLGALGCLVLDLLKSFREHVLFGGDARNNGRGLEVLTQDSLRENLLPNNYVSFLNI